MSIDQLKVQSMKKLLGFSQLSRFPTIYLIFFNLIVTRAHLGGNAAIEKCCPRGQVLSSAENYTCAYFGDRKLELHFLRSRGIRGENLLSCVDPDYWTIFDVGKDVDMLIRARNTCVDLLYDATLGETMTIFFECHRGSNGNNGSKEVEGEIGGVTEHREWRRFKTLRMCCEQNRYFDRELRECTLRQEEVNVTRFLNFLGGAFDFVTVVTGLPTCKHAILDYIINVTTDVMVLPDGKIGIVLPTNSGPQTILAEQENTCLDPDSSNPDLMIVRVCSGAQFCSERRNTCVRKCCPEDEFYGKQGCVKKPSHASPVHFHDFFKNVSIKMASAAFMDGHNTPDYGLLIGIDCKYGMYPREDKDSWRFTPEGEIYFPFTRFYEHHEYCFDKLYGDSNHAEDIYPFLCRVDP